jgi:hypothetical protein
MGVVELRVPNGPDPTKHAQQHWVITEAFWADSIAPPDVGTVVSWLREDGAAQAASDLTVPHDPSAFAAGDAAPNHPIVYASNQLLVSVFSSILLLAYVALRAVFTVLPLPAIRDGVLAPIERLLTSWAGDMRVLLFDEAQAAVVRTTFGTAVRALESANCSRIAVVAHSGGAVASYMTLTDPQFEDLKVTKLITFGQGLNIARRLLRAKSRSNTKATEPRFFAPLIGQARPVVWHDFYATEDPVPRGPVRAEEGSSSPQVEEPVTGGTRGPGTSVSNRWSIRDDHGGYWDNDEEFVLPVIRHLDVPSLSVEDSRFSYPDRALQTRRRRQRVSVLAMWRQLCFSGAAAAIFVGIIAGQWAHYSGQPPTGQSPFVGIQGPLRDVWQSWQWTGFVSDVLQELRTDYSWPVALVGAVLWPTLAAIATASVLPQLGRWLQPWSGSRRIGVLTVAAFAYVIVFAGALAIAGLYATALFQSPLWQDIRPAWERLFDIGYWVTDPFTDTPNVALVAMSAQLMLAALASMLLIAVAAIVYALWRVARWEIVTVLKWLRGRRLAKELGSISEVAGIVVTVVAALALLGSAIYALVVSSNYGWYVLTLLLATVPFFLLNLVAVWRWKAWDEQERWEFRNRSRRRLGRGWDAAIWLWLALAAIFLVVWIAVSELSTQWSVRGLIAALSFVSLVIIVGIIQDAKNVRGTSIRDEPEIDESAFETASLQPQPPL